VGKFGAFFFSEEITQLEAFKATQSDPELIAKVDEAIEILKNKESK
jgi:hypothetical protein